MPLVPTLLLGMGTYFLIRLRAFFLVHPFRTLRRCIRAFRKKDGRPFATFALALAGTLGVGNLSGIALGLMIGGAGCLFWMWVATVFACVLKYAEVLIAKDVSVQQTWGGMMQAVRRFLPHGKSASLVYALLCLLLAATMGTMLQSRAVAECAEHTFGLPTVLTSAMFCVLLIIVMAGGGKGVDRAVSVAVPVAAGGYILLCLGVLCFGYAKIPTAVMSVFRSAFTVRAGVGGMTGLWASAAVRRGFSCGLLSNEAGAGTSTLAHIQNGVTTPGEQGTVGICEVLCDTAICTLTGLALLVGGGGVLPSAANTAPMAWLGDVFAGVLGGWCLPVLFLSVFAFAFATVVCWYAYGMRCVKYICSGCPVRLYALLYLACTFAGGMLTSAYIVKTVDVCLAGLCLLTLTTLFVAAPRIVDLHREGAGMYRKNSKKQRKRKTTA